ncbi:MAG: hypothetical protein JO134_12785 [Xanthobacteraceae bacterium]|nr:hypothetical protein [Xanthobacteraceae bacterium]
MRSRPMLLLLILACAALVTAPARAQGTRPDSSAPQPSEATVQAIVSCLSQGREAVMVPQFHCEAYGVGAGFAQGEEMPLGLPDADWNQVCRNKDDPRRLSGDIIKRIVARKEAIAPSGIRIMGGIFCGDIDLVGLDLPYSVVIDYALVNGDLDGRNLRVRGDLSFEHTIILGNLLLNRAHVDGSVYGGWSFIDQLLVNDSQIDGTWWQSDSVMLSDTQFHHASFSGDLRLDNSAFTQLSVLSSNIGGTLGLNNSEARCAYHINSSSMNYFTASGAGFGRIRTIQQEGKPDIDYPWWDRAPAHSPRPEMRRLFESPAVRSMVKGTLRMITAPQPNPEVLHGCEDTSGSAYAEFYLFDSNVRSASCIASFAWLAPKPAPSDAPAPVSILALNGTRVTGNLIIDLAAAGGANPRPGTDHYKKAIGTHKLEAIGATAGALIFNFDDESAPYFTFIDGLNFDRIHNASPACTGEMVQLATQVELPSTDKVLHWLEKNKASSSQPFTAFAAAFERAGESAVNLRVGRQTYDLCAKTAHWTALDWLAVATGQCPRREQDADPAPTPATQQDLTQHSRNPPAIGPAPSPGIFESVINDGVDLAMIAFNWGLYGLADYGLRPAKVIWSILITVGLFALWFWFYLRVIGFEPKRKDDTAPGVAPDIWPLGFLFLFDRLIPLYQIRDQHYSIGRFFRRVTRSELKATPAGSATTPMLFLGRKVLVAPATEAETRRIEKWLVVLRAIGAIFTIFLVAAVASLTK